MPEDYDPGDSVTPGTGYSGGAVSTRPIPVTVDKHKYVRMVFNDQEISGTKRHLAMEQMSLQAYKLGRGLVLDLFSAITAANFPTSVLETEVNTDTSTMGKIRKQLTNQGAVFPRYGIVNPNVFEALSDDNRILNNQYGIEKPDYEGGILTGIRGFSSIFEFAEMPDNAENLTGYFGNPQGLVLATRVPSDVAMATNFPIPIPGLIKIIQDPDTGLGIMVRCSYNMDLGQLSCVLTWMYGFAKGVPEHATRLVKA